MLLFQSPGSMIILKQGLQIGGPQPTPGPHTEECGFVYKFHKLFLNCQHLKNRRFCIKIQNPTSIENSGSSGWAFLQSSSLPEPDRSGLFEQAGIFHFQKVSSWTLSLPHSSCPCRHQGLCKDWAPSSGKETSLGSFVSTLLFVFRRSVLTQQQRTLVRFTSPWALNSMPHITSGWQPFLL